VRFAHAHQIGEHAGRRCGHAGLICHAHDRSIDRFDLRASTGQPVLQHRRLVRAVVGKREVDLGEDPRVLDRYAKRGCGSDRLFGDDACDAATFGAIEPANG